MNVSSVVKRKLRGSSVISGGKTDFQPLKSKRKSGKFKIASSQPPKPSSMMKIYGEAPKDVITVKLPWPGLVMLEQWMVWLLLRKRRLRLHKTNE